MVPPMVKQPTGEPAVVAPASTHIPAKPAPQGQDESTMPYKQPPRPGRRSDFNDVPTKLSPPTAGRAAATVRRTWRLGCQAADCAATLANRCRIAMAAGQINSGGDMWVDFRPLIHEPWSSCVILGPARPLPALAPTLPPLALSSHPRIMLEGARGTLGYGEP